MDCVHLLSPVLNCNFNSFLHVKLVVSMSLFKVVFVSLVCGGKKLLYFCKNFICDFI